MDNDLVQYLSIPRYRMETAAHLFVEPQSESVAVRFDQLFGKFGSRFSFLLPRLRRLQALDPALDARQIHCELFVAFLLLLDPRLVLGQLFDLCESELGGFVRLGVRRRCRERRRKSFEEIGGPSGRNFLQDVGRERTRRGREFREVILRKVRLTSSHDDLEVERNVSRCT